MSLRLKTQLALVILLGILSGCSDSTTTPPSGVSNEEAVSETADAPEPDQAQVENGETDPALQTNEKSRYEVIDMEAASQAWKDWTFPKALFVITGRQHGYIEPCGCTGLDRQKGGMARRYTLIKQLRDKGWPVLAIDAGNQVRRFGRQAEIKLQQTAKALKQMNYSAVGLGPDDLRLGVGELLAVAAGETEDDTPFASANVVLIDPSLMPSTKQVSIGEVTVGITSVIDPESISGQISDDIKIDDPVGAISVHGICGIWGTLACAIFADFDFMAQLKGALLVSAFAFIFAYVVFSALKAIMGVRVSEEEEDRGLDITEHGQEAYTN